MAVALRKFVKMTCISTQFKSNEMKKLEGKTAIITGGNSGIGFATAQDFIAEGAKVIITGRNKTLVNEAVEKLGIHAKGIVSDTGNMDDVNRLAKEISVISPAIDIIFINAGVGKFNSAENMSEEMFDEIMDVNFKGAYFSLQQLLPLVNNGGSIIFNTSINANIGMAGASVYSASKAALISLIRNLSVELLHRNIRVNAISPGPVETPLHTIHKLGITQEQLADMGQGILKQIPIGRFGKADEIAKIATFFASDDSSFIIGAELVADGGMSTL